MKGVGKGGKSHNSHQRRMAERRYNPQIKRLPSEPGHPMKYQVFIILYYIKLHKIMLYVLIYGFVKLF